jgi:hypothetical protein
MEFNTLRAFYDSIENAEKLKKVLLKNITTHEEKTIILNLVQLEYDFDKNYITIEYYVEDKNYPNKILSFEEFEDLVQNKIGRYNYKNALILYSIFSSEQKNGAEIKSIIAYADYVNHEIMTFEEFTNSIKYLLQLGLIKEICKKLFVENSFKEWYNDKYKNSKRIYVLKMVESIQKYLYEIEKTNELNKNFETKITEKDFEDSVNEYIK